jgi:hypothetical protein
LTDAERVKQEDLTAEWMVEHSENSMVPLDPRSGGILISHLPILAYALVTRPTGKAPAEYCMVGIAAGIYDQMS